MKILIVAAYNTNKFVPFILDQVQALQKDSDYIFDFFGIRGKGIKGYLSNLGKLKKKIKEFKPDLIHAHYGLSGLLANLQRKTPVVTTYHGSDINRPEVLRFSKLAIKLSKWNIFVSQKNINISGVKRNFSLIPCGVDLGVFVEIEKQKARALLDLNQEKKYVLFAGVFANKVKNYPLAKEAVDKLSNIYSDADVLVFIDNRDTVQVPGKTLEILATNKPILFIYYNDDSPTLQYIRGYDGIYFAKNNKEEISFALTKICLDNSVCFNRKLEIFYWENLLKRVSGKFYL